MAKKINYNACDWSRHKSRIFAIQNVFAALVLNLDEKQLSKLLFEHSDFQLEASFTLQLIQKTLQEKEEIITTITKFLKKTWTFKRLFVQDQAILLVATCELLQKQTSPKIIINEAVEISKKFSSAKSTSFINALLDKIAKVN